MNAVDFLVSLTVTNPFLARDITIVVRHWLSWKTIILSTSVNFAIYDATYQTCSKVDMILLTGCLSVLSLFMACHYFLKVFVAWRAAREQLATVDSHKAYAGGCTTLCKYSVYYAREHEGTDVDVDSRYIYPFAHLHTKRY